MQPNEELYRWLEEHREQLAAKPRTRVLAALMDIDAWTSMTVQDIAQRTDRKVASTRKVLATLQGLGLVTIAGKQYTSRRPRTLYRVVPQAAVAYLRRMVTPVDYDAAAAK